MIQIENIKKKFGKLEVLKGIHLTLDKGACIALIGPNGCGKTTLIKIILGMVLPDEGDILFQNKSILRDITYRSEIGYMPQIGRYPENMTVGQVIELVKGIRKTGRPLDEELYNKFGIDKMLSKKMRTLSGGTIQKVSAVLAFLYDPAVLILDEPTAGLDPLASEILKEKIISERNKGKLILITSHLLSELDELISELIFIQEGQLLFHKNVTSLKEETGCGTVAKAIIQSLKSSIPA